MPKRAAWDIMREREVPVYLYKTGAESDGKVEVEGKSHT
jgi:hypothetical protein